MKMEDAINNLPGDLKRVAEVIGLEAALTLADVFGGGYLVIPKCEGILKEIRNRKIRELYDAGGITIRELAWKFKLSDRQIKTILSGTDEEIHPTLFDIMKKKL